MLQAGPETPLSAPLAHLWERRRDSFLARVGQLDAALTARSAGELSEAARDAAEREAHKLAGTLGMFGLHGATELVRELELGLRGREARPQDDARLIEVCRALLAVISAGPAPDPAAATAAESTVAGEVTVAPAEERVLVVLSDDRELQSRVVAEATAIGMLAWGAADLEQAAAIAAGRPSVTTLVDLQTPGIDLANQPPSGAGGHGLTVALMSDASLMTRVGATRHQVALCLDRATSPTEIIAAITDLLDRRHGHSARVMLVDDDSHVHQAVAIVLAHAGIELTSVPDPRQLWEKLTEAQPDLLILDVDLDRPDFDGLDLCRAVRSDPRYADLPILFLTASHEQSVLRGLFASGADDYVPKPINGAEFLGRVESRLARARLGRQIADRDLLTRTLSRRKATSEVVRAVGLARRDQRPLALAMLDVDRFKAINDSHGHAVGDSVLRTLGALLNRSFRREDIVGRWGGEEFIICLNGAEGPAAQAILDGTLSEFRTLVMTSLAGASVQASFSAGVACLPRDGTSFEPLCRAADAALYAAKHAGRGRVLLAGRD